MTDNTPHGSLQLKIHFNPRGFGNTYLINSLESPEVLVIDPGEMSQRCLDKICSMGKIVSHVLITHHHSGHTGGLKTLLRVFPEALVHSYGLVRGSYSLEHLKEVVLSSIPVQVIHVPGHSEDSLVFRIGGALFTGDTLMAGKTGKTGGAREKALFLRILEERILSLDEAPVLGGHGPPTTLNIEKRYNPDLKLLHLPDSDK